METTDVLVGLGISGLVAMAIAIVKSIVAPLPAWAPRLLALVFVVIVVVAGMAEGAYDLTLLEAIAVVVAQTAEVIGIRELTTGTFGTRVPDRDIANLRIGRPDAGG